MSAFFQCLNDAIHERLTASGMAWNDFVTIHSGAAKFRWVRYRILDIPQSLDPQVNTCGAAVVGTCRVVWYCVISIKSNPLLTSPVSYISITSYFFPLRFFAEMNISFVIIFPLRHTPYVPLQKWRFLQCNLLQWIFQL